MAVMDAWIGPLLTALALPKYGLSTVFVVAFVSATLLPMGSEPAVFGLGALTWWMGSGAERVYERVTRYDAAHPRALRWLERFGPRACLLSWLPVVGDPLCAVAGWLRLPFWPCVLYMAIGKCARYVAMTALLLWVFPGSFTL